MPVPSERDDKRISLAPLDFEQALGGILAAGPHPEKDDEAEPEKKATPPQKRRAARTVKPSAEG